MELSGKIKEYLYNPITQEHVVTLAINEGDTLRGGLRDLTDKDLSITIKKGKRKRSLDANGLLWACINDIAQSMTPPGDKWQVYLDLLKNYGRFTYICVTPSAVEAVKTQWRESEEIGKVNINGREAVQLLCYYGSSTYNTEEFSRLLDGVVSEMEQMGIAPPPSEDMKRALERLEGKHEHRTGD